MNYNLKRIIGDLTHKNAAFADIYFKASQLKMRFFEHMSDEDYKKKRYKENTGNDLNLQNPVTFDEKLCWLMINNRDPLLTKCCDKYLVRNYIEELGLGHILNELYGVYDSPEEIDYDLLPKTFFLKSTHGSGSNIRCNDKATFPKRKVAKKLNNILKQNYYLQTREWCYKDVKPRIVCERILENKEGGELVDFNFFCFHGEPKILMYNMGLSDQEGAHAKGKRLTYDMDFNVLNIETSKERFDPSLAHKPINFDRMIEYAKILSKPFPHVRVDFYNLEGQIYFGEMTFYSGGGNVKLEPKQWQLKLGSWIDLTRI